MFEAFRRVAPPVACVYPLADGTRALVRRVRADDEERLRTGYILLSEHSRRLRYFGQPSEMPLQFLGELDEADHVGWGALDAAAPDGLFMGVGRYVRIASGADAAEVAITVLDPYQSRGVGILLHACLHRCAYAKGVRRFVYDVSEDNDRFIHHLRELGARRLSAESHAVRLEMPVYCRASRVPQGSAAGKRLREVMAKLERAGAAA